MTAKRNDGPKSGESPDPEDDAPDAEPVPEPDYSCLVARELRVAQSARDAAKMYAPILARYQALQRLLIYVVE